MTTWSLLSIADRTRRLDSEVPRFHDLLSPVVPTRLDRRTFVQLMLAGPAPCRSPASRRQSPSRTASGDRSARATYHVHPGGSIQDALEAAARDPVNKTIAVHAGTYRPAAKGQALIWFNARHDGITLEAVGDVTLTAANPDIADRQAPQLSRGRQPRRLFRRRRLRKTVLRGFRITGANNFTTGSGERSPIESDDVRKTPFFYADGGGIKIYARSYPTIEHVEVDGNYTSPCGGGVSVEHLDQVQDSVLFRDCIFREQPHADHRIRGRPAARQPRDDRELPVRRQRRQPRRRLRRHAERRRISPGARLRRADGVRAIARVGHPLHVHRQLERRRRQRRRQHLCRLDLLEEHAGGRHLGRSPATRSTSSMPPACAGRSFTASQRPARHDRQRSAIRSIRRIPRFDAPFVPRSAPEVRAACGLSTG